MISVVIYLDDGGYLTFWRMLYLFTLMVEVIYLGGGDYLPGWRRLPLDGGGWAEVIYLDGRGLAKVVYLDGGGYFPGWRRLFSWMAEIRQRLLTWIAKVLSRNDEGLPKVVYLDGGG